MTDSEITLQVIKDTWVDEEWYHKIIHERYSTCVDGTPELKAHRDYVERNVFGMGERSFWWLWKLILDTLPENPKLLEVGVFKAATLSFWKLLCKDAEIFGITPLDGRGTGWTNEDYFSHITKIHSDFGLDMPYLIIGGSEEPGVIAQAKGEYDVVYVDGDHSEEGCLSDLNNYSKYVKIGGYLAIDDCCCDFHMPWGYFQGIQSVQDAFNKWDNIGFEFVCNVVHLRVLRRVS